VKSWFDKVYKSFTLISAIIVILVVIGIFISLYLNSKLAIDTFGFIKFILSSTWNPGQDIYGGLPAIFGTIISTLIALIIAAPIALGIGIFLSEICPQRFKNIFSTAIELLAAIPSIIYGMWALFFLAPFVSKHIAPLFGKQTTGICVFTAGLVLAIMIIPYIAAIVRDAIDNVPSVLKESAYALGANKYEVVKNIIIPYTKTVILGAIILALGRALGETMAVTFVMGNVFKIPKSLFEPGTSITVKIANEFNEAYTDLYVSSLFLLGFILFIMSFTFISLAKAVILKKKIKA